MKIYNMLKKYRWIWVMAPLAVLFLGFCSSKIKKGEDILPKIILQTLSSSHYQPVEVNDTFSVRVFDLFLKRLDRGKRFFIEEDFNSFIKYKYDLDDQAKRGSYEFFDLVSQTYLKRVAEVEGFYEEILSQKFDFTINETYTLDEENRNYFSDLNTLQEDWRKYLKWNVLDKFYSKVKAQEKFKGKSDSLIKPLDSLQYQAHEEVLKTQRNWFKRLKKFDREKQLDIYINCMTEAFDPHTSYYPPKDKEDFDIRMSGRLEGIGAQLSERDGEIKVEMIVPGSPSYLQGELKEGDIVIKVAQKDSTPVSVVNMDLSDAVQLIRGKKGTTVILTVRKPDGEIKDIAITRDVVVMEEGYAKSAIIEKDKKKYGFIQLPQFYTDMNSRGGRTCSKDVKAEVEKLIAEGVEGIILDLRNNGGGSLQDVVDMAGLFIGRKPVVQAKFRDRNPDVLVSNEKKITYKGPLIVMVNKYSASASEILAAALQDYERALILGTDEQSFGKGTVQRFLDLDRYAPNSNSQFGSLKITIQKFYRVNGGTTQLTGVLPDMVLPDKYSSFVVGERSEDYPLQWNEINALPIKMDMASQKTKIQNATKKSARRVSKNPLFNLVEQESKRIDKNRKQSVFNLNFEGFKAEQEKRERQNQEYDEALKKLFSENSMSILKKDTEIIGSDSAKLKLKNDWLKAYKKDFYLSEAANILLDL
jgi:carboxyl-terminal processing protease